jgi:hypothetical protein
VGKAFVPTIDQAAKLDSERIFAGTLVSLACPHAGEYLEIDLDSAEEHLGKVYGFFVAVADGYPRSATIATLMLRYAQPVLSRQRPVDPTRAALVRLQALALAIEADRRNLPGLGDGCRAIAGAMTLLSMRAKRLESLETIVLARL